MDPKTEKDNSEPVTNTESKPELSNPLDPESALVVEIPRTRMKPFCEDLSQRKPLLIGDTRSSTLNPDFPYRGIN